jgi:hypothetical protein
VQRTWRGAFWDCVGRHCTGQRATATLRGVLSPLTRAFALYPGPFLEFIVGHARLLQDTLERAVLDLVVVLRDGNRPVAALRLGLGEGQVATRASSRLTETFSIGLPDPGS